MGLALAAVAGPGAGAAPTHEAAQLLLAVFSFDFSATMGPAAANDEFPTVLIPRDWAPDIARPGLVTGLFDAYARSTCSDTAAAILQAINMFAGIRRLSFTLNDPPLDVTRGAFVGEILDGLLRVINGRLGLDDPVCLRELCRLVRRLRVSVMVSELNLLDQPQYLRWLEAVGAFTEALLADYPSTIHSSAYLLGFWAKMGSAYEAADASDPVAKFILTQGARVFEAAVRAHAALVRAGYGCSGGFADDALEPSLIHPLLIALAELARRRFPYEAQELARVIAVCKDEYAAAAAAAAAAGDAAGSAPWLAASAAAAELAWLVRVASALVEQRRSATDRDPDAVLCRPVVAIVAALGAPPACPASVPGATTPAPGTPGLTPGTVQLECSLLSFQQAFCCYIDMSTKSAAFCAALVGAAPSPVGPAAGQAVAVQAEVLSHFAGRDLALLRAAAWEPRIAASAVAALETYSARDATVKTLWPVLPSVRAALASHHPGNWAFSVAPGQIGARQALYRALGSALFFEKSFSMQIFDSFVAPYAQALAAAVPATAAGGAASPPSAAAQGAMSERLGVLLRDLAGLAAAATSSRHFALLITRLQPHLFNALNSLTGVDAPPAGVCAACKFYEAVFTRANSNLPSLTPAGPLPGLRGPGDAHAAKLQFRLLRAALTFLTGAARSAAPAVQAAMHIAGGTSAVPSVAPSGMASPVRVGSPVPGMRNSPGSGSGSGSGPADQPADLWPALRPVRRLVHLAHTLLTQRWAGYPMFALFGDSVVGDATRAVLALCAQVPASVTCMYPSLRDDTAFLFYTVVVDFFSELFKPADQASADELAAGLSWLIQFCTALLQAPQLAPRSATRAASLLTAVYRAACLSDVDAAIPEVALVSQMTADLLRGPLVEPTGALLAALAGVLAEGMRADYADLLRAVARSGPQGTQQALWAGLQPYFTDGAPSKEAVWLVELLASPPEDDSRSREWTSAITAALGPLRRNAV